MRTIYLSAGHSTVAGRDRGAAGNGFIEGVEAAKIRTRVVQILKQKYNVKAIVDPDDSILSQTLAFFRNLTTNRCIVVDIHFNAAGPTATGTETLVESNPTQFELDLAFVLSKIAHNRLGIPRRGNFRQRAGVKSEAESHHGRLGWMRLTGENALIEVCFISNANDMASYQRNFEAYCSDLAFVLYKFAKDEQQDLLNPRQPQVTLQATSNRITYTVVSGDTLSAIARRHNTTVQNIRTLNNLTSDVIRVGQRLNIT
jgi:N-acetylmuramoyl-L-alanine amidase